MAADVGWPPFSLGFQGKAATDYSVPGSRKQYRPFSPAAPKPSDTCCMRMRLVNGSDSSSLPAPVNKSQLGKGATLEAIAFLSAGVIGAALVELVGPSSVRYAFLNTDLTGAKGISAALVAVVSVLILHELGHLAGAIGMRFEITGITLGPLRVDRTLGRSSWRFIPRNLFK